MKTKLGPGAR
uniref:Uncharacterized protein n=1 Tax=Salix viminalis TaxID=40686 RepID=A0A6N2LS82_SALVM